MKYSLILLSLLFALPIFAQNNLDNTKNVSDSCDLQVTRYRLHPQELNIQEDIDAEKINLKIYYQKEGSIVEDFNYFNPKKNEILFFFGNNPENQNVEMFFKLDDELKSIYKKKDFKQLIKVIEVLEYNVFPTDEAFSGEKAYAALERL